MSALNLPLTFRQAEKVARVLVNAGFGATPRMLVNRRPREIAQTYSEKPESMHVVFDLIIGALGDDTTYIHEHFERAGE